MSIVWTRVSSFCENEKKKPTDNPWSELALESWDAHILVSSFIMWDAWNDLLQTVTWLALQYEGAAMEDGKGRSIWDTYSHTEGEFYKAVVISWECHTSTFKSQICCKYLAWMCKCDDKYRIANKSSQLSTRTNWLRVFLLPNLQGRFLGTPMETLLLTNITVLRYLHELCFMSIFSFCHKILFDRRGQRSMGPFSQVLWILHFSIYAIWRQFVNGMLMLCRRTSGWWKIWAWMHTASQLHGPASSHVCE